jgi:ribose/xylose/arabinose/galactoside ABC-type transport system permease subunit
LETAPMTAIYVIAAFIVVMAILNRIEFGRFD